MGSKQEGLPHDVVMNILARLPVKSLLRFKCVSKEWLNLIKSPFFTQQHLLYSSRNPFLLLQRYHCQVLPVPFTCYLVGPHNNNPQITDFPMPFQPPTARIRIVASCNGLLCLREKTKFSLFNPATNRIKNLPVKCRYFGFGFTPQSNDYKIVGISTLVKDVPANLDHDRVGRAHVYSLNSGSSKEIDAVKLQPFCSFSTPVAITGNVFWLAKKGYDRNSDYVVSFDIEREFFTLLNGPPSPTGSHSYSKNLLAVCNDKLAMFHHYFRGIREPYSFDLWVLEGSDNRDVVGECWVKMYSVGPFSRILYPLSIWRDEVVCEEAVCEEGIRFAGGKKVVSLFNPFTYESKNLLAHRSDCLYVPFTYAESLVQL
ncbi:hypothetical protein Fmac_023826 [Flemingia macrophylla]|uniref:F-box domain-containing protein n=1 Tax=Flemingia macrophylla TaxID=520843 RepID=A0ABD1LN66_9FABA